jgi:flagellin-like hook-associated protein FlgL
VRFGPKSAFIDGVETFNYSVRNFPLAVLNAWGYQMFNIEDTKVVMNIEPYEKNKAVRMIDRSLIELASQSENSFKASSMLDKKTHIETLVDVLRMLQNDNETLFSVTLHFTIYNKNRLTTNKENLLEQQNNLEGTDMGEESTNWKTLEAIYNMSLQMATSVIPMSIFDFLQ